MFPFDDELFFEDPLIFQQEKILEDLLEDPALLGGNDFTSKGTKKRQRKNSVSNGIQEINKDEGGNEHKKKIMHRDVERQRRQEMAGLYASLRSLLPPQYIKGKRSVSDHMHEAVNYIKHMQKNIKEMQVRRDKLNKLFNLPSTNVNVTKVGNLKNDSLNHIVEVNLCCDGIEILVTSGLNVEDLPLSIVLVELLERGLNVVDCVSTRSNKTSFHRIQIEGNTSDVDLSRLQERLTNVINNQPCLKS